MVSCLNSYGCQNLVKPGQVFCCEKCQLIYRGELKPDYSNYKPYNGSDKDFNITDTVFQKFYGCNQAPKKKRGVKPGTKRGPYQSRSEKKLHRQLKRDKKKTNRDRVRKHRLKKKQHEQARLKELLQ